MSEATAERGLLEKTTRTAVLFTLVVCGAFGGAWLIFEQATEHFGIFLGFMLAPVGFFGGMLAGLLVYGVLAGAWWLVRPKRAARINARS